MTKLIQKITASISIMALLMMVAPQSFATVSSISVSGDIFTSNVAAAAATQGGTGVITVGFTTANAVSVGGTVTVTLNSVNATTIATGDLGFTLTGGSAATAVSIAGSSASKAVISFTVGTATMTAGAQSITITQSGTTTLITRAAGAYATTVVTPAEVGSQLAYIGGANQVVVSAVVEPILTFSLSANTANLGTLTTAGVSTATTVSTIATNATSGYSLFAESDNAATTTGLYDTVSLETIIPAASSAIVAATSNFGLYVSAVTQATNGDGTVAATAGFDNNGAGDLAITAAAQSIATSAGTADGDTVTATYQGAVSAVQAAGSYATTVTYTLTGNF